IWLSVMAHYSRTSDEFCVKGGNDLLPRAFAERLGDRILYSASATRIEQDATEVRVVYARSGKTTVISADRLVCAIPFTTLRRIEFSPPLSPGKRRAVDSLRYTPVTRVFLETASRFWADENITAQVASDLPIGIVEDHTFTQAGTCGIIESHTANEAARKIVGLSGTQRLDFVVANLEMLYGGVGSKVTKGVSVSWDDEEYNHGAYAYFAPGEMTSFRQTIAKPEGLVHFAGEHTSGSFACMEGAVESGLRAAREINESSA
ncbi:MAG: FAD-dependent oxidoreductase, partial [Nitrososphaerota archaeon]|nr:FAD-dependent oxidoreductase [Nitrososphaerota archaeon]